MIINFKIFCESTRYDTYNGPSITTWSGDNRTMLRTDMTVAGGNGGSIGAEFDNVEEPTARPYNQKPLKKEPKKKLNPDYSPERVSKVEYLNDLLKKEIQKTN